MKIIMAMMIAGLLSGCADYAYQRGCNGPIPLAFNCK